jgi:ribosomal protein L10
MTLEEHQAALAQIQAQIAEPQSVQFSDGRGLTNRSLQDLLRAANYHEAQIDKLQATPTATIGRMYNREGL